jgi:hypothetical protein
MLKKVLEHSFLSPTRSIDVSADRTARQYWWLPVSVLATGSKGCGLEPGKDDGFLRAIKIRSKTFSRMGIKAGRSHVRFYGKLKNSWSTTGMDSLNSYFLHQSPTGSRDISGNGQSALVDKLGVRPSRSRLLTGPHRYHPGIVQEAHCSVERAVSPHHNNQSIIYWWLPERSCRQVWSLPQSTMVHVSITWGWTTGP